MAGAGSGLIVTANAALVPKQPVATTVSVTLTLPDPATGQLTVIWLVPCPLAMLPPVTVHT